jgi:hypothetical protein
MGDLIAFRAAGRRRHPKRSGAGAEILFFTGVRYQRTIEHAPLSGAAPRQPQQDGNGGGLGRGKRRRRG